MRRLIEPAHELLEIFQPKFKYLLQAQRDVVETSGQAVHTPPLVNNLAWLPLRLEHKRGSKDATILLNRFAALTEGAYGEPARAAIATWTRYVLLPRELPKSPDMSQLPTVSFTEIVTMLTDTRRSWYQRWLEESRVEGEAQMLQRQLTRRFGPRSQETLDRLKAATAAQLETWSLSFVDASTLEDVFRH